MQRKAILVWGFAFLLAALAAGGEEKGKIKRRKAGEEPRRVVAVAVFMDSDKAILRDYAKSFRGNLPPGLAKRGGNLPPGLEKQLVRNGQLPAGLEKRIVPFSAELERRLSPLEPGLRRGFIAGHAVIINRSTRVILDVFSPLG